MDEATKKGYGMLMLRQGLPKSEFYASAIARLRKDVARDVGVPIAGHVPFGILGKSERAPRDASRPGELGAITRKLDRLHENLEAFRRERPPAADEKRRRADGRDEATVRDAPKTHATVGVPYDQTLRRGFSGR